MRERMSRRRLVLPAAGMAVLAAAITPARTPASGLPGGAGRRPVPANSAPGEPMWSPDPLPARRALGSFRAYVALAGAYRVATVDVTGHVLLSTAIHTDAGRSVAVTPDGSKLYVANTGQYDVLVADPARGTVRPIHVGPHPQDVTMTPDGGKVYATVPGGGGVPDTVAVIDTGQDAVIHDIPVGSPPREVAVDQRGTRAYVTGEGTVTVIDAIHDRVIRTFRDPADPQGVAVSPDGGTLVVTHPRTGDVALLDSRTGRARTVVRAGDLPWAVAVAPDGSAAYVAVTNDGVVAVVDMASRRIVRRIHAGRLPEEVAVTPDGSELWAGDGLSGRVSVIATASGALITNISGGTGTRAIGASPVSIVFGPAPPDPAG